MEQIDFAYEVQRRGLTQPFETSVGWDHQLYTRHLGMIRKRCIFAVDKGLGKTWIIESIFEDPLVHKNIPGFTVLILCPEKGMGAYIRDIKKFPDWENKIQLVYGNKAQRAQRWKTKKPVRYFICTYASFLSDIGVRITNKKTKETATPIVPQWVLDNKCDGVVFDEYHRQFRRRSKTWAALCKIFRHTEYCFPMTGSAVRKSPEDLWAALHLVDPKFWSSYWNYVYTWCEVDDYGFGKTITGPKLDRLDKWRAAVEPYVVQIKAEMVKGMPEKVRDIMDVNMPAWQKKLHDDILKKLYVETPDGEFIFAENVLSKINILRQILVCPKAINEAYDVGQGIQDIFEDALESGANRYAIFTAFRAPIPYLAAWLRDKGARVWVLQGGIGLDEQTRRLDAWTQSLPKATPEAPSIILSTVKYAESWEIPEARYGYILGAEWDQEDNKQAEDRLRRLISTGCTYIRYIRHRGAYDGNILELLVENAANVRMMFKDFGKLKKILVDPDAPGNADNTDYIN